MARQAPSRPVPGDGLLHPVALVALIVLVANDHVLKAAWGGLVTGKLSDAAGLVLAPLVAQALWEVGRRSLRRPWGPSHATVVVAIVLVGAGFAAANTLEPAAAVYRVGLGLLQWPFAALAALMTSGEPRGPSPVLFVRDPWDLLTLPALAVPLVLGYRRVHHAEADSAGQTHEHEEQHEHTELEPDRNEGSLGLEQDDRPGDADDDHDERVDDREEAASATAPVDEPLKGRHGQNDGPQDEPD